MEFNATFLVSIISFLLFMIIMEKILYTPITKIVTEREELIDNNYSNAKAASEKASSLYQNRNDRLGEATANAKKLASEKLAKANEDAKLKTMEAKKNSIAKINAAKENIKAQSEQINNEINNRINEIAENISAKVLGEI